jgi:hypothetical protein
VKPLPTREIPVRSRLEVFESIVAEYRALIDERDQRADDAARALGAIARAADLDHDVACTAVTTGVLADRGRSEGHDDLRQIQISLLARWFGEGYDER